MNESVLGYHGEVTLKFIVGDKVLEIKEHNSGTDELLKSFAKFLAGYGTTALTPQYLGLEYSDDDGASWSTILAYEIPLSEKKYDDIKDTTVGSYNATFTGVISYSYLTKTIVATDPGKYRFSLYAKDTSLVVRPLAYLSASAESLATLSPGTQAVVSWSMFVKNV